MRAEIDIHPRLIRHDDVVAGVVTTYLEPQAVFVARDLDQVRGVIEEAQTAAERGHWAVGFVTYEAAPAFDPAMVVRPPCESIPLACFVEFRRRQVRPRREPAPDRPSGTVVAATSRRGGSAWYRRGVATIRDLIAEGEVYQVNLTDRIEIESGSEVDVDVDAEALYRQLCAGQGSTSNWLIDLGCLAIVAASPERFFELDGKVVRTRPMKGTARRRPRQRDDVAVGQSLLQSQKDRAENVMIVDLLRNDLSRIAVPGGVAVPHLFDLERYETVWQLTSAVEARIRPDTALVDVFDALFPCGSITGAPKIAAMAAIAAIEPWPRSVYCGAVGVVEPASDLSRGPSARFDVAIRTAVIDRSTRTCTYGSGGGITWDSDPGDEDSELEAKAAILTTTRPGFELLETLRLDGAGARNVALHLERLADTALYFGFPVDLDRLASDIAALELPATVMRLRITVSRNGEHHVGVTPLEPQPSSVRLVVAEQRIRSDDPFVCHKTTERSVYDAARVGAPWADDVIMVNERGEVVETTIASLLYRRDGQWWTPPLSVGGLAGIGRKVLLDQGVVAERRLDVDQLGDCDELATVSSLRGWRPATLCEGRSE